MNGIKQCGEAITYTYTYTPIYRNVYVSRNRQRKKGAEIIFLI